MVSAPDPRPMALDEFVPLVGQTLLADCGEEQVPLVLVEASPSGAIRSMERPPFLLVFRSAPDALLVDGIYTIHGRGFGPAAVSITSLIAPAKGEPGYYYQAIFN